MWSIVQLVMLLAGFKSISCNQSQGIKTVSRHEGGGGDAGNAVEAYFDAERKAGLLFVILGLVAVGVAVASCYSGPFWHGAGYSLVVLALIQIVVGLTVWIRSPKDIARVEHMLVYAPERIVQEEIPRVKAVLNGLSISRRTEIILFVMAVFLLGLAAHSSVLEGFGAGVAWQVAMILLLDYFSEKRANIYLAWLVSYGVLEKPFLPVI